MNLNVMDGKFACNCHLNLIYLISATCDLKMISNN